MADHMDLKLLQDTPPWEWPRNTGRSLLSILRNLSADPADRLLAAEMSGEIVVMNDAMADALLAIVGSAAEPEGLRAQAAISLGPILEQADINEFDDPDMVPVSAETIIRIKQSLRKVYLDTAVPKLLRRRILEASVRAPEEWHESAIRNAWTSDDQQWKLTAVFCMRYVRGFDKQIIEGLDSADAAIQYEAIRAAGSWEVDPAWPHVAALVAAPDTNKDLLLAAIEAVAAIRPREAGLLLEDLANSDDEDIADAADEAMSMAAGASSGDFDDGDDDE